MTLWLPNLKENYLDDRHAAVKRFVGQEVHAPKTVL